MNVNFFRDKTLSMIMFLYFNRWNKAAAAVRCCSTYMSSTRKSITIINIKLWTPKSRITDAFLSCVVCQLSSYVVVQLMTVIENSGKCDDFPIIDHCSPVYLTSQVSANLAFGTIICNYKVYCYCQLFSVLYLLLICSWRLMLATENL